MKMTILISALFFLLFACKESESVDFGFDYFPMKEGTFIEYDVLEVFHDVDINPQHDTTRYRLKTKIGEEILDNSGKSVRKYFQLKYDLGSGELIDQRVWTRVLNDGRGEVVEENERIIKMVFAVRNDKEWDVNAFNTLPDHEVFYSNVGESQSFGSFTFEETAIVNYEDFFSLVDYHKKYEVYARGIGLVKRSFKDFTIQNFDTTAIKKGTEVHYQMINYGLE